MAVIFFRQIATLFVILYLNNSKPSKTILWNSNYYQ